MDAERWLAPLSGAVALGVAAGVVGLYAYGGSLPEDHHARVVRVVPQPPEEVWPLLADLARRTEWAPGVTRMVRVEDIDGKPVWRALDASGDRFDVVVEEAAWPTLRYRAAKPEDIGMDATWTWTLAHHPTGTRITVAEDGRIGNPLYRAIWTLRDGPDEAIGSDLAAFSARLRDGAPSAAGMR